MQLTYPMRAAVVTAAAVVASSLFSSAAFAQTDARLVAREGLTLPGSGAATVNSVNTAFVNGNGQVGFLGILSDNARFIFFDDSIIFLNTDVTSPTLTGGEGTIGISNTGGFAYSPSIDGGDGIYSHIGVLARDGDPFPGGRFYQFNSRPRMSADGTAWWIGGTSDTSTGSNNQDVFWKVDTSTGSPVHTQVLKGGDTIGGRIISSTGLDFNYDISDNGLHFINEVSFAGASGNSVVLNGSTIIVDEDAPVGDGSGNNWGSIRFSSINNSGDWLVYGDDDGPTTSDDILMFNGAVIARQGQTLDGVTLGSTLDGAAINNVGNIVQLWDLTSSTDEGLFFGHSSNPELSQLVLRTGDTLDFDGDGVADAVLDDFNASSVVTPPLDLGDDGWIYLDVDITPTGSADSIEAVIGVLVPEPGALSLLACSSLALLRRRSRR